MYGKDHLKDYDTHRQGPLEEVPDKGPERRKVCIETSGRDDKEKGRRKIALDDRRGLTWYEVFLYAVLAVWLVLIFLGRMVRIG